MPEPNLSQGVDRTVPLKPRPGYRSSKNLNLWVLEFDMLRGQVREGNVI